jgi:hypothetical protein
MEKIIIKAPSGEHNAQNVNILIGIDCGDEFVEYCDDDYASKLKYGYMSFDVEDGKLYTITEYIVKDGQELSYDELVKLGNYTQGQWSDGIGEGFEQFPCCEENGEEIFVSPWYRGQKVEIIIH